MSRTGDARLLLWVDAVGGFLICSGRRVLVGQAVPVAGVDVPIQADVSRRHLTIHRDQEGYVAAAAERTVIDGRLVQGAANLRDGALIELGGHTRLQFRQPHPLSATARLNLVSHHRTQPAVDGIILMADTLILGPTADCHILARQLSGQVVLFRQNRQWRCRTEGEITVNGDKFQAEASMGPGCRVEGRDFSLTLEIA
ncbi:MAG: hypothetical protein GTO53_03195 [Planctomycetales bacterium]|nr:hypothetical protein [Planctomycetales bacterium]NIM08171.1 hypothetical protein [Planctomycetales bacterium]NIN07668.1 hypothetical protein [Planctomycetales bacterium]NIN76785.1 hypothetical protein [Planctomycetales bacterium]NIO33990.1 hypothetical protein [Planctomycetales bacterium]